MMKPVDISLEDRPDTGAALLVVMLLVATLSIMSVGILEIVSRTIRLSALSDARSQSIWFVQGAETLARSRIEQLVQVTEGEIGRYAPGLGQPFVFPIDGGQISARIDEASNCFNLNSLGQIQEGERAAGEIDPEDFYNDLLGGLDIPVQLASELVASTADWIDADSAQRPFGAESGYYGSLETPRAAANGPLVSDRELLDIKGYTPDIYRRIEPHVCALPGTDVGTFNINTLTMQNSPLLVAVTGGQITLPVMHSFMERQEELEYPDVETFLAEPPLSTINPDQLHSSLLDVTSSVLRLSGEVVYLESVTSYEAFFRLADSGEVSLIRRRIGADE